VDIDLGTLWKWQMKKVKMKKGCGIFVRKKQKVGERRREEERREGDRRRQDKMRI